MSELENQVIVVTGASGGLGSFICKKLSDGGAFVVAADIDYGGAAKIAAQLNNALAIKLDVTNYLQCEEMVNKVLNKYKKIDALVSNAAILIAKSVTDFPSETWKKVIDVNLVGYFNCAKAVIGTMLKQGKGNIVQINSKSGKKGSAKNSAYATSKFGGIGLTQSLALEFAEKNIRVNCICPGNLLNSPLWVNSLFKQYSKNQGITKEQIRQKYINKVPMKRSCEYEDITNVLLFLLSDKSSYMTGQAINVTGGQEMR